MVGHSAPSDSGLPLAAGRTALGRAGVERHPCEGLHEFARSRGRLRHCFLPVGTGRYRARYSAAYWAEIFSGAKRLTFSKPFWMRPSR